MAITFTLPLTDELKMIAEAQISAEARAELDEARLREADEIIRATLGSRRRDLLNRYLAEHGQIISLVNDLYPYSGTQVVVANKVFHISGRDGEFTVTEDDGKAGN